MAFLEILAAGATIAESTNKILQTYGSEARFERVIEATQAQEAAQLYIDVERLKQSEAILTEVKADLAMTARILKEHVDASFGASPERVKALRQLSIRRWDPDVPRNMRDMWFKRAEQLDDHEVGGLLLLKEGPITFVNDQPYRGTIDGIRGLAGLGGDQLARADADMRVKWSAADAAENASCFFFLGRAHDDLVVYDAANRMVGSTSKAVVQVWLTPHGQLLVAAMTAYEELK